MFGMISSCGRASHTCSRNYKACFTSLSIESLSVKASRGFPFLTLQRLSGLASEKGPHLEISRWQRLVGDNNVDVLQVQIFVAILWAIGIDALSGLLSVVVYFLLSVVVYFPGSTQGP